jgi:hypothetical protein
VQRSFVEYVTTIRDNIRSNAVKNIFVEINILGSYMHSCLYRVYFLSITNNLSELQFQRQVETSFQPTTRTVLWTDDGADANLQWHVQVLCEPRLPSG